MKLRLCALLSITAFSFSLAVRAQEPPGVPDALAGISSQPATHTSVVFDRDMMQGILNDHALAEFNSITFQSYRYRESAFYTPEGIKALRSAYNAAGWHHLVDANVSPKDSASPTKPITDMWLHFQGGDIDGCTVLIRSARQMNVIEVSGVFRPLDLVHLSGHFGIPKIDPGAVMVPAPPGR